MGKRNLILFFFPFSILFFGGEEGAARVGRRAAKEAEGRRTEDGMVTNSVLQVRRITQSRYQSIECQECSKSLGT